MSLDRFLAIYSFKTNSYRKPDRAVKAVLILWIIVFIFNIPHLFLWEKIEYLSHGQTRTVCMLKYNSIRVNLFEKIEMNGTKPLNTTNNTKIFNEIKAYSFKISLYYFIFFFLTYILPFLSIVIIYGLILLKLSKAKGQQVNKSKKRVTSMVIAVVSCFVLCWGPLQVMMFLQHVVTIYFDKTGIIILVIANSIGYLNSCLNPIIYVSSSLNHFLNF
jgi:hypothetical protein